MTLLLLLLVSSASAHAAPSAAEILQKADEVRNPAASYRMLVEVTGDGEPARYEVALKGRDKTLVRTLAPARDKGRDLLMLGDDLWAYIPNLKRAIRVGLSQKLTGEAANGDIARVRWTGDYDARIEKQDGGSWTIFLTAQRPGLTYDKLRVTIDKADFHPQSADYLALSGDVLKHATFRAYKQLAGGERPSEIEIADATHEGRRSLITIKEMEAKALSDSEFQQANLPR